MLFAEKRRNDAVIDEYYAKRHVKSRAYILYMLLKKIETFN